MLSMYFLATPDLQWACVAALVTAFAFNGGVMSGYIQNIIGLAPNRWPSKISFEVVLVFLPQNRQKGGEGQSKYKSFEAVLRKFFGQF